MKLNYFSGKIVIVIICALVLVGFLLFDSFRDIGLQLYSFVSDREKIRAYVFSFGTLTPVVFMVFQILQVVLAPVPGEVTGFVGGYLFGAAKGFFYSSIGLAAGSCIIFMLGRFSCRYYILKLISCDKLKKIDTFTKRQGILIIFFLYLFPGFPKDYLSFFLGITSLRFKIFVILTSIGRMPGTLVLSIQGASLFDKDYLLLALITCICLIFVFIAYRYRNTIYAWIERINGVE